MPRSICCVLGPMEADDTEKVPYKSLYYVESEV